MDRDAKETEKRWDRNGGARRHVIYDGPDLITVGITFLADRCCRGWPQRR